MAGFTARNSSPVIGGGGPKGRRGKASNVISTIADHDHDLKQAGSKTVTLPLPALPRKTGEEFTCDSPALAGERSLREVSEVSEVSENDRGGESRIDTPPVGWPTTMRGDCVVDLVHDASVPQAIEDLLRIRSGDAVLQGLHPHLLA